MRYNFHRRGAGAVERGALEKRCGRKVTVGSNPTLSAQKFSALAGSLLSLAGSNPTLSAEDTRRCLSSERPA